MEESTRLTPISAAAVADEERDRKRATNCLKQALDDKRLVIVTGVGATLDATGYTPGGPLDHLSWKGMLEYGYRYLKKQPPPRDQQKAQERDLSIRNMRYLLDQAPIYSHLQAAQILRRELEECGDFAHWLNAVFGDLAVENDALFRSLKELHDRGATILTTNYDCLLDSYCGLTPVCGLATQDAMTFQWGRRSRKEIFHIHGTYERPRDVILDPIDYYRVRESEGVRRLLEMTLLGSTVLFVGCGDGLGDANLGGLLRWISELQKDLPRTHTMLIKNDDTYNFHPLVRLKYGSNYSDLGPWLWNELLEHKNTTLPANGSRLAAPSNDKRPRSTGGLRGGDSGEGSNLNGSVHRQNEASVRAKAEYDYAPDSENSTSDIPLEAGEIICNIERNSDGWWRGTNSKGKRGLFPSNYVSTLPEVSISSVRSPVPRTGSEPGIPTIQLPGDIHECDYCKRTICGIRYKCTVCPDWDYCMGCAVRADTLHNPEHTFKVIYDPGGPFDGLRQPDNRPPLNMEPVGDIKDTTESSEVENGMEEVIRNLSQEGIIDDSSTSDIANAILEAINRIEPPITSLIPTCSDCMAIPESYPVYECQTCEDKPIICRACRYALFSMSILHPGHDIKRMTADLWFDAKHIFLKKSLPRVDAYSYLGWGLSLTTEVVPTLRLGHNILSNIDILCFNPRPGGNIRFALFDVPPGRWEVRLQIRTRPSPKFGVYQMQMCESSLRRWLWAGLVLLGHLRIYAGLLDDATNFLYYDREDPAQTFTENSVEHPVTFGTGRSVELRLPLPIAVTKGEHVAFYATYDRNLARFSKQPQEVRNSLSFSWMLEGIHFVQYQSDMESLNELIGNIR